MNDDLLDILGKLEEIEAETLLSAAGAWALLREYRNRQAAKYAASLMSKGVGRSAVVEILKRRYGYARSTAYRLLSRAGIGFP